jgi:hypothetical protein
VVPPSPVEPEVPELPEYDISDTFIMYAAEDSVIEFTQLEDFKDTVITNLWFTDFADTIDEVINLEKLYYKTSQDGYNFTLPSGKYIKMDIMYGEAANVQCPIGKFNITGKVDLIGDTVGLSPDAGGGFYDGAFYQVFAGCDIRYAHNFTVDLQFSNAWLCQQMFSGCKKLITTPKIININSSSGENKYIYMFENCSELETVTELHFLNTIGG